mgnify:CR=1 FL=1
MRKYIDCHCHLEDSSLESVAHKLIENFAQDKVDFVINSASDKISSQKSIELSNKYADVYATAGCHPHEAKTFNEEFAIFLTQAAKKSKLVAIGEIGLDYYYDLSERDCQRRVFAQQIRIADSVNLPIVIHSRDAWEDTLKVLEEEKKFINNGILLHCYSGSGETAKVLSKKYDAYFSFGGAITFKNYKGFDIIASIPTNRLLTETDSPYLTPVPFRGKINTPKNVAIVAQKLAQMLKKDIDEFCFTIKQNTCEIFKRIIR